MKNLRRVLVLVGLTLGACGGGSGSGEVDAAPDPVDARRGDGGTTVDASCFDDPQTHAQLLNACVDWQHVDKVPVTPLLNDDGTLPPLPP